MVTLVNVILPIFLAAGVVAAAQPWLKLDVGSLSRLWFHVFLPALVFESLVYADLSQPAFGKIALAGTLVTMALWALGEIAARLLHLSRETRGSFLIALLLVNAANYGLPAVTFAFGDAGLPFATVYLLVNTLFVSTLGVYLAAQGKATAQMALRRLLGVPALYASILGVLVNLSGLVVPEPIMKAVHLLREATVATSLVVLGLQLARASRAGFAVAQLPALIVVLVGRLVVSPFLAVWAARWVGLQGVARNVFVLDCALPAAVLITILAGEFESDTAVATLSVFTTTIVSLLTVTLWLNWLL